MAMSSDQLVKHVIDETLDHLGLNSEAAVNLLLLTAAVESDMGSYLGQINGPALGIYQMEPDTYWDIHKNFLKFRPDLHEQVSDFSLSVELGGAKELAGNLYYATAMARVHYLRFAEPLPKADDVEGLAKYWKKYWNTDLGAGTVEAAIYKYTKYVTGLPPWELP